MRFQVPQFIDVEDKIFGPLTWRQFVYTGGGAALSFICYKLLPWYVDILLIPIIAGAAVAFAFVKINNKPFIQIVESAFRFLLQDKLYIWKQPPQKKLTDKEKSASKENETVHYIPKLSRSKIEDISWGLNVLDTDKRR